MLTVIIKDNGEKNVTKFTYQALWRELKDIPGAELYVNSSWFEGLKRMNSKNRFVCFVEPDCLVGSGYFSSMLGLLEKNEDKRSIAVMGSATAVSIWVNKMFGYKMNDAFDKQITPIKQDDIRAPHPVQIAYVPGSIIRVTMLKHFLEAYPMTDGLEDDLIKLSLILSLGFWGQSVGNGIGCRVYINPLSTYATTENHVNDIAQIGTVKDHPYFEVATNMFERLMI